MSYTVNLYNIINQYISRMCVSGVFSICVSRYGVLYSHRIARVQIRDVRVILSVHKKCNFRLDA